MRNYRATVEYDGTDFRGFQVQAEGRTVQGALEDAFARLLGERIGVVGAGRTDAGVHASGQVISFRTGTDLPIVKIERGVNALLPPDVAVTAVEAVADGFHARYSATSRTYAYSIWNGSGPRPLLRRTTWWVREPLDVGAMTRAAVELVGARDFSSFAMKGEGSRVRTVRRAVWIGRDGMVVLEIEADGFLRGMVRGIVGTHVGIGRGKIGADEFGAIIDAADRDRGAASAPARGLCLVAVGYAGGSGKRATTEDEEDE